MKLKNFVREAGTATLVRLGTLLAGGSFGVAITESDRSTLVAGVAIIAGLVFDYFVGQKMKGE